jgi:hypothetical protein
MSALPRLLRLAGGLAAGLLAAGVVLYVLDVPESSWVAAAVMDASRFLASPFRRIVVLDDNDLQVAINFGIAAAVYLLAATAFARLARRYAETPPRRGVPWVSTSRRPSSPR